MSNPENTNTWEQIVDGLPLRTFEECEEAYELMMTLETKVGQTIFPDDDGRGYPPPSVVLPLMDFPKEVPDSVREIVALAAEYLNRTKPLGVEPGEPIE